MVKIYRIILGVFLIVDGAILSYSKSNENPSGIERKRTGRIARVRQVERYSDKMKILSSSTPNSEQIDVASIEDKIVRASKSFTGAIDSIGLDMDDEDLTNGSDGSGESWNDGSGKGGKSNNFVSLLKNFDDKVKRLKKRVLGSNKLYTLYSSQQGNDSGVALQNQTLKSNSSLPTVIENTVNTVSKSSVVIQKYVTSSQPIVSSSVVGLDITPTRATGVIQETLAFTNPVDSVTTVQATKTLAPTTVISNTGRSLVVTETLAASPVLKAVTSVTEEKLHPQASTPIILATSVVAEEKPTTKVEIYTTSSVQIQNTSVLFPGSSTSEPTTNETLPPESTGPTTAAISEADVKGKATGDEPGERNKGLFRSLSIEILIALVAGALCALLLVAFLVYRLKKRNEGSYELSESMNMKIRTHDDLGMEKEVLV